MLKINKNNVKEYWKLLKPLHLFPHNCCDYNLDFVKRKKEEEGLEQRPWRDGKRNWKGETKRVAAEIKEKWTGRERLHLYSYIKKEERLHSLTTEKRVGKEKKRKSGHVRAWGIWF